MKQGAGEKEEDDDDNQNNDEDEKEDMKNILSTLKSPVESKVHGKKTRGYFTTKNNIKKPLTYFKICEFCGKKANICECQLILKGMKKTENDKMDIEMPEKTKQNYKFIIYRYKIQPLVAW